MSLQEQKSVVFSQKNSPNWGGARTGAGRKKGKMLQVNYEKMHVKKRFDQKVLRAVSKLFSSQFNLATGLTMVYKVRTYKNGVREHILVTDPLEIKDFLDKFEGNPGEIGDDYYYITTKEPDNRAIDSLLDRVFGRARNTLGLDGGADDKPIPLLELKVVNHVVSTNDGNQQNLILNEED